MLQAVAEPPVAPPPPLRKTVRRPRHLPAGWRQRYVTRAEFATLPETVRRVELIAGEIFMPPSPKSFHQGAIVTLVIDIGTYLRAHPLGRVFVSPFDVHLEGDNVLQPDVFFVSNERLGGLREEGFYGGPDLVIEVLSKSTREVDLGRKRIAYARAGVLEFWVFDPTRRSGWCYRAPDLLGDPAVRFAPGDTLQSPLLPGLTLQAGDYL